MFFHYIQFILLLNQGALLNPQEDSLPTLSIIAKLAKKIENIKAQDLRTDPERLEYSEEVEKKRQEWEDIDKKWARMEDCLLTKTTDIIMLIKRQD